MYANATKKTEGERMVKNCFGYSELALVLSSTEDAGKEFEFN